MNYSEEFDVFMSDITQTETNKEQNILDSLNDEQRAAVLQTEGPVLINAGAGSGKTRVLTSRIALHMEREVPPERILALTFTRKAANEMKERIAQMSGEDTRALVMGTFHSVFVRFLREYSSLLGYPQSFTIYDEDDSLSCLKNCINTVLFGEDWKQKRKTETDEEASRRKKIEANYKPRLIRSRISLAKNDRLDPETYATDQEALDADKAAGRDRFSEIYSLYVKRCRACGAMDFDDILMNTEMLFKNNTSVLEDIASRFDYILVDEYQDTNSVQYAILRMLTSRNSNICVVGDDSQSIYGFRGARIANILNFRRDYPGCTEFRLVTNYRSTGNIVDAANTLIEKNSERLPKVCRSARAAGSDIDLIVCTDDREEAQYVCNRIQSLVLRGKCKYGDFAILYRTNAQSQSFENIFIRNKVPYMIYSGISFFQRAEVKDVLAWFRLSVNPSDDEAFRRALMKPGRGIGPTTLEKLAQAAILHSLPLYDMVMRGGLGSAGIKPKAENMLREFAELVTFLHGESENLDASQLADLIAERSGIYNHFASDRSEDGKRVFDNVEQVFSSVSAYVTDAKNDLPGAPMDMASYLEDIVLLSSAESAQREDEAQEEGGDINRVQLMTVHSSKGLEFPYVFVVGAEEGLFPSYSDELLTRAEEEEERRLFYVAMTRAQEKLELTYAGRRFRYGKVTEQKHSRFLSDIELFDFGEDGAHGDDFQMPL